MKIVLGKVSSAALLLPEGSDGVLRNQGIGSQYGQAACHSLADQHAIKRVAVKFWNLGQVESFFLSQWESGDRVGFPL